jgi:general secretion pathway protein H
LLELLLVLLIAVSAISLVLPQISTVRTGVALKASARELAGALRATRSEAIARHREVPFVLDAAFKRRLAEVRAEVSADAAIRFFPDGSSTGGKVTLGAGGLSYVVQVDWLTGRVVILE